MSLLDEAIDAVVALAVTVIAALSGCSHSDDAQTSGNDNSNLNANTPAQAPVPVEQVAVKQETGSGDVIASANMAYIKKDDSGLGKIPPNYIDNFGKIFVRYFASIPNVDQVQVARLVIPELWRENNAFKQQDIMKAKADKLKNLPWGKDGLVATTVNHGAFLNLTDPAKGTYLIHINIPVSTNNSAGISFGTNAHTVRREYDVEKPNDASVGQLTQVVGESKAREVENLVGASRDQNGNLKVPVTFYVRLKKAKWESDNQLRSDAAILVEIDHADLVWGDVYRLDTLVSLTHQEMFPAPSKAKGGTPSTWY
jgi:hypothetical protein